VNQLVFVELWKRVALIEQLVDLEIDFVQIEKVCGALELVQLMPPKGSGRH
jgi:hypothetical protein